MLAVCLIGHVGSPDDRREFRPSEVPTFAGSSDTDLHALTSDSLCTVFSVIVGSPEICVGTSDVDLNGSIFTWGINTLRQNLTVQIYVGSSNADPGTSDI